MADSRAPLVRERTRVVARVVRRDPSAVAGVLVLAAWLLVGVAGTASIGFLNLRTVPGLLIALGALAAALVQAGRRALTVSAGADAAVLLVAGGSVMYLHMYSYLPAGELGWLTVVTALGAATVVAGELCTGTAARVLWLLGVGTGVGALLAVTALDPAPRIDVWVMLQQSADGLAHLSNFYAMHWVGSPGWQQDYPYLPVTTLLLAPFRWLFADVRIGLVACMVAVAGLLALPWRRDAAPRALPALVLFLPGSLGLVEQSWTEPVLLLFLAGAFLAVERGRPTLAAACFALALAAKQHVIVLIPLFAVWRRLGLKRTALAVAGAVAICVPWFAADPSAFLDGVYRLHADAPARPDAPELYSLALQHGWTPPGVLLLAVLAAVVAAACWLVYRNPRTGNACLLAALVLFVAALLNKQSFYNQYWLPAQLLIVGLCIDARAAATRTEGRLDAGLAR